MKTRALFATAGLALASSMALAASLALDANVALAAEPAAATRHNVVIFVADGLRSHIVTPETAPVMAEIRKDGVDFANSHAMYPTVTTVNASAIATGHRVGDTGNFGNSVYLGKAVSASSPSPFAAMEDDETLNGMNSAYNGNYLNETSLLAAARRQGFATAIVGKLGPTHIQDVTATPGETLIIDDATGYPEGYPLPADVKAAIKAAGLDTRAEDRGLNGYGGDYLMSGVHVANVQQQDWMVGVATKVVLPRLKASGKPFVLVYWSRDPDGTQHANGDSLNSLYPGINGPTSLAAVRNADNNLKAIRAALKDLGLAGDTDIVVTADHGFSTVSRESHTSTANRYSFPDVKPDSLPPGFLAIDLAAALKMPLMDDTGEVIDLKGGFHPKRDAAVIGQPGQPEIATVGNGGSTLLYLTGADAKVLAPRVVSALLEQDYVAGIFVNDDLGAIPGTLPFSAIGLIGSAITPKPSMVVSYRSFVMPKCAQTDPELCAASLSEGSYTEGQGIHGSLSRADTHNFMAAIGPDFKSGFVDPAPVSNADWTPTLAQILGVKITPKGGLVGRVMAEALPGGAVPAFSADTLRSAPSPSGLSTVLNVQKVGDEVYLDAGGIPGRVVGLKP